MDDQEKNELVAQKKRELKSETQPMAMVIHRDPEIDLQISTAKAYPRSVSGALKKAKDMACLTQGIAESCIYKIPRADKMLPGPSVRLAEIVASCWGNMRIEGRPAGEEGGCVLAEAGAWDLESNLAIKVTKKRRITDKFGRRFSDDMIAVTANAAVSIALRDAILRVVPKSVSNEVFLAATACAVGTQQTLSSRRDKALSTFALIGVPKDRVLKKLSRAGVEDITLEDLATLVGLHNAIREGDADIDEEFPPVVVAEKKAEPKKQDVPDFPVPPKNTEVVDPKTGEITEKPFQDLFEKPPEKKVTVVDKTSPSGPTFADLREQALDRGMALLEFDDLAIASGIDAQKNLPPTARKMAMLTYAIEQWEGPPARDPGEEG